MDLRECYVAFGGDYDEVLGRLQREQTVRKFVCKFLDDKSFHMLEESIRSEDYEEALRAVHTLKGICQNLSFTRLYESSSLMTKAFKGGENKEAVAMMSRLSNDYHQIINTIQEYIQSEER